MQRFLQRAFASLGLCLSLLSSLSLAAGLPDLTVGGYTLVSSVRVNRTDYDYTYKAKVTNSGTANALGVSGTLGSRSPNTRVVDGALTFGDVSAGGAKTSVDTFTIRQNRLFPFSWADLSWTLSGNIPPTASFTATPETGPAPLLVQFNAGASADLDGSIAGYQWNFGDGQSGGGPSPSHDYAAMGSYTVRLTVIDNRGATSSPFSRVLTVTNATPVALFTATPQSGEAPLAVNFDASTSYDPDGSIASY